MYILVYTGANQVFWPMVSHFHHTDWQVPGVVDGAVSSVLFPLLTAYLLAATLRERSSPWPFLFAPLLAMLVTKYVTDSFYPPFWSESLSLVAAGAIQGVSAWAGWFLCSRWSLRAEIRSSANAQLHAQSL